MEMIQNAYQGFAKQNYTMLDNLKLGYGGTKEEMQRLLDDAEEISGIEYDISSFADITEAIHVMQEEMGIAGATALEAGTTIEGSVNSMKSAWQNLLTGFADGNANIGDLISNLVTTVVGDGTESNLGVLGNVLPTIETALGGIAQLIEGAAPIIIEILPGLIEQLVPSLISSATSLVNSVIEVLPDLLNTIVAAIIENAPMLLDSAFVLVGELISGILSQLPQIVQLGLDLIVSLALGIANSLDELIPAVVDVILEIVDILTDPTNLSNLIDAALLILTELAYGLIDAIPQLVDACVEIILGLANALLDPENLLTIVGAAIEIVIALAAGLINAIPELIASAAEMITELIDSFSETDWGAVGTDIINSIWEGLQEAWESIKSWFSGAWDSLFGGRSVEVSANAGTVDGSHYSGIDYVPADNYIARLHRGERVLTREENMDYTRGGSAVNVTQNIYSRAQTAADLMQEAIYQQERAVMLGV